MRNYVGWIEHNGGECPVASGKRVDIRLRDGCVHESEPAEDCDWRHAGDNIDIVAYKLAERQHINDEGSQLAEALEQIEALRASLAASQKQALALAEKCREQATELDAWGRWRRTVTFTTNDIGDLISITNQEPPGNIINVMWEKKFPEPPMASSPASLSFEPDPRDGRLGKRTGRV